MVERRRGPVPVLQRVQQFVAGQFTQRRQREMVSPQPRFLGRRPGRHLRVAQRPPGALAPQPVVMEPAQPAPVHHFTVAARHRTRRQAPQRRRLGNELGQRPPASPPRPFMAETQATTKKIALATGHRAHPPLDRPGKATSRSSVEVLHRSPSGRQRPTATIATAVVRSRSRRAPRRRAPPHRGAGVVHVPAEQPQRLVPFPSTPPRLDMSGQPLHPPGLNPAGLCAAHGGERT